MLAAAHTHTPSSYVSLADTHPACTPANDHHYRYAHRPAYARVPGSTLYEEFHPFGTTAYAANDSGIEVSKKRYRYIGKERDEETGLYQCGARYLAAWLGRWTAADPIGLGDGVNRYAYARGNPVRFVDPRGTKADILETVGKAALSVALGPAGPATFEEVRNVRKNVDQARRKAKAQEAEEKARQTVLQETAHTQGLAMGDDPSPTARPLDAPWSIADVPFAEQWGAAAYTVLSGVAYAVGGEIHPSETTPEFIREGLEEGGPGVAAAQIGLLLGPRVLGGGRGGAAEAPSIGRGHKSKRQFAETTEGDAGPRKYTPKEVERELRRSESGVRRSTLSNRRTSAWS